MFDALVGTLLMCIIGGGTLVIAGRLADGQRTMRVQNAVVRTVRDALVVNGTDLCSSATRTISTIGGGTADAAVTCGSAPSVAVTPGIQSAVMGVPATTTVNGIRLVQLNVPMTQLGVQSSDTLVVGNR